MANQNKPPPFLLSTVDNPYSPFDEWIKWYMEDLRLGYDTCGLIARLTVSADSMNDDDAIEAMKEIASSNLSGKHIMVTVDDFK